MMAVEINLTLCLIHDDELTETCVRKLATLVMHYETLRKDCVLCRVEGTIFITYLLCGSHTQWISILGNTAQKYYTETFQLKTKRFVFVLFLRIFA